MFSVGDKVLVWGNRVGTVKAVGKKGKTLYVKGKDFYGGATWVKARDVAVTT